MGKNQSKEEIFIAQAGNSGEATIDFFLKNYMEIIVRALVVLTLLVAFYKYCKKRLEKKIRREISRNQELV